MPSSPVRQAQSSYSAQYAKRLGQNIAYLREKKDWSQERFTLKVQTLPGGEYLYRQTLSKAELGQRVLPIFVLEAIAKLFELPLDFLTSSESIQELQLKIDRLKSN